MTNEPRDPPGRPRRRSGPPSEAATEDPRFTLERFRAPRLLAGAHVQTLAGKFLRSPPPVEFDRERWDLTDGDFLDLDFVRGGRAEAPLVVVLHGLEGSARRRYALLTYDELARRGLASVGLNFRSCSGEPNRLARSYHSGDTADLAHVLDELARRFPGRDLAAVGFSLGGNVLLKHLGEVGARGSASGTAHLGAAVAISVPFDLSAASKALQRGFWGRLYTRYFMRMLKDKVRRKEALLVDHVDVASVLATRTLKEFDDAATAPLHGFRDAEHYYAESSCGSYLGSIAVPTLVLHARDDPFLPARRVPEEALARNRHLVSGVVDGGGHVGFVTGSLARPRFWAEVQAARFLSSVLAGSEAQP